MLHSILATTIGPIRYSSLITTKSLAQATFSIYDMRAVARVVFNVGNYLAEIHWRFRLDLESILIDLSHSLPIQ